ncbi:MAG: PAS domain-containing protein [Alphaproteobacteria bacterium]|nr:PAS domain-containing protein [Rhodospirillales bacterium]MCW9045676.1 PAS domain-containing protein [Alphaproteobacteria bacterium]
MAENVSLTGVERTFDRDDIIVSKTNTKGQLTYVNNIFLEIADYTEAEIIGKPHNVIRHPDMPRCIFKALWDSIKAGEEIFAYVMNRTKYGDYYWVLAHVTPTFEGPNKEIVGYHSNRRVPEKKALDIIKPLYAKLLAEEKSHSNPKEGLAASTRMLQQTLEPYGGRYDKFVLSI